MAGKKPAKEPRMYTSISVTECGDIKMDGEQNL